MSVLHIMEIVVKFVSTLMALTYVPVPLDMSLNQMDIIVLVSNKSCLYKFKIIIMYVSVDINECDNDNGGCAHTCINQPGSYQCQCDVEFNSESNRMNCTGN